MKIEFKGLAVFIPAMIVLSILNNKRRKEEENQNKKIKEEIDCMAKKLMEDVSKQQEEICKAAFSFEKEQRKIEEAMIQLDPEFKKDLDELKKDLS